MSKPEIVTAIGEVVTALKNLYGLRGVDPDNPELREAIKQGESFLNHLLTKTSQL